MKKSNRTILIVFVIFVLLMVGVGLLVAYSFSGGSVAGKTILQVDLETQMLEYVPPDPFAQVLMKDTPQIRTFVETLTRAANDDRVAGLVARVGEGGLGFAQLQEVRDAILAFRDSGKPAYAFSETFGEVSRGNGSYYLASAFDKVFLQQSGDVNLTGLILESQFLRGTLEKLEVEPRMGHRHEYKNAMNTFTETAYTEAHREAMSSLMTSIFDGMIGDIAESRGLAVEDLRGKIAGGPYFGQEAVDAGLVDSLAYRDEVYDAMRDVAGEDAELSSLSAYRERAGRVWDSGKHVALIYGVGSITRGKSQYSAFGGSPTMGSDTVAAAFRAAVKDSKVEAILFRIDCNGGSYVASDAVLREVQRAQEAGKPVIVSMGNVAASGGYFVALSADKVVAQPGTITGSIGVLGGKLITTGLMSKLGLSFDHVETSTNASHFSPLHDYDEAQWARHNAWLDRVYDDFTRKVAEGRGLPLETVQEIAKGRVWTGTQALENGLVDELGGFPTALRLIREELGVDAGADLNLRIFPRAKSPWEELLDQGSSSEVAVLAVGRLLEQARPLFLIAQRAGLLESSPNTLALPPEMVPQP